MMGKSTKRPKSFYLNNAKRLKRSSNLASNIKGFLCTCSDREKDCVREAYNILNSAADQLYGKPEIKDVEPSQVVKEQPSEKPLVQPKEDGDSSSDESVDIEAALKNEVKALKEDGLNKTSVNKDRFKQVRSGANNCIFITTTLEEPVDICVAVMDNIIAAKQSMTKRLIRMIPVQNTCKAYYEDIEKCSKELLHKYLPDKPVTYCVVFRARNNNSVNKGSTLLGLAKIFTDINEKHTTSYKEAEFVLSVEIIKNMCCLSLLPSFFDKYCKYNLLALGEKVSEGSETKVESVKPVQTTDSLLETDPSPAATDSVMDLDEKAEPTVEAAL